MKRKAKKAMLQFRNICLIKQNVMNLINILL